MSELEDIADELVVIGRGRLIASTTVSELLAVQIGRARPPADTQVTEVMVVLAEAGGTVTSTGSDALVVTGLEPDQIAELVAEQRAPARRALPERASLEDAFIDLTRDAVEYVAEHPGRQGS